MENKKSGGNRRTGGAKVQLRSEFIDGEKDERVVGSGTHDRLRILNYLW